MKPGDIVEYWYDTQVDCGRSFKDGTRLEITAINGGMIMVRLRADSLPIGVYAHNLRPIMSMNLTLTPEDLKDPAAMGAKIGEWTKKVQAKPLYMPTDAEIATSSYFRFGKSGGRTAKAWRDSDGTWSWWSTVDTAEFHLTREEAIKRAWNFVHGNS